MTITLNSPLDMHLHLREGEMLKHVAPLTAAHFSGAVIMPNLRSPVDNATKLRAYKQAIEEACLPILQNRDSFIPYMTLFFRNYSKEELQEVQGEIIGIKLYPAGITTQSEKGVKDVEAIGETASLMEELGIPLLIHGESNGFVMDREKEFLPVYSWLAESFPRLQIVMEHITTAESVELLHKYDNIAATVTLHHLMITLDDVLGGLMQPHLFCKPVAKRPRDRAALREAVFSGHERLIFGSDSAPHPRHHKECCGCAAGVFSAPVALPLLATIFAEEDRIDLLENFISGHAQRLYGIQPPQKQISLREKPWTVPEEYNGIRPYYAGETIPWQVVEE